MELSNAADSGTSCGSHCSRELCRSQVIRRSTLFWSKVGRITATVFRHGTDDNPQAVASHLPTVSNFFFFNLFFMIFLLLQSCYKVVFGGVPEAVGLLKVKFDYIFATCSSRIGRKVMTAAVENLTPVTLELGGKWYVSINK